MALLFFSFSLISILTIIYLGYFLLMYHYCKRGKNWDSKSLNVKVSLIVAVYNEESTLPTKLKNVLEQDYSKELLELVIIDSGSTDRTPKIVEEFMEKNKSMKVLFIREKERLGKSHALNVAYPKASGEIKIISDSDAVLDKSAITRIVSNFSDPNVGAACGRQVLLNPYNSSSTLLEKTYRDVYGVLREGESVLDSTPIFHGELSAYKADLIDPLPENKSADDSRLANVIRRKGYRAVYDSSAVFFEYAPPNLQSRFIQKVRRGQGLIRVFWDFKGCMFRKRYGAYGLLILPMELLMHCVFPALWLFSVSAFLFALALYAPILFLFVLGLFVAVITMSKSRSENSVLKKLSKWASLFLSFLSSQVILFYALMLWISGKSLHKWQKVEDIRREWKTNNVISTS